MIEVKQLSGSDFEDYGIPFNHIYVLNDGNTGKIIINSALEIDIEKIDKVEDLKIKKLEWAISGSGSTFVILSHEKLSTDYITKLMLSRIYTELQKKSNKKKVVYVDASSTTTVPAGASETITIQPPAGKIWRLRFWRIHIPPIQTASSGTHELMIGISGVYYNIIAGIISRYSIWLLTHQYYAEADTIKPVTQELFAKALSSVVISNTYPLQFTYTNNTDATGTESKEFILIFEEEDEAT